MQSSLPTNEQQKFTVFVVGLCSDSMTNPNFSITIEHVQTTFPSLKFYAKLFLTSAHTRTGILEFRNELSLVCNQLLDDHASAIPRSYEAIYNKLQVTRKKPLFFGIFIKKSHYLQKKICLLNEFGFLLFLLGNWTLKAYHNFRWGFENFWSSSKRICPNDWTCPWIFACFGTGMVVCF